MTLTPEAAAQLRADLKEEAELYPGVPSKKLQVFVPHDTPVVDAEIDRVLKDDRLILPEAPILFRYLYDADDGDRVITLEEAQSTGLHQYLEDKRERLVALRQDIWYHSENYNSNLKIYDKLAVKDPLKTLKPVSQNIDLILANLELIEAQIQKLILYVENYKHKLDEDSTSCFSFVSAENLLGLSAWINDGEPFSEMERHGVEQFLFWLRSVEAGRDIFEYRFRNNVFSDHGEDVEAFVNSPFFYYIAPGCHLLNDQSQCNEASVYPPYFSGIINEATSKGADRLAESLFWYFSGMIKNHLESSDVAEARKYTRPGWIRFIDNDIRGFANCVASLDSLAALATGSIAGKLIARAAFAVAAIDKASKTLGWGAKLLPGVTVFAGEAGEPFYLAAGKFMANLTIEITKVTGIIEGTHHVFGRGASEWAGRTFNFFIGAKETFGRTVGALIAREAASDVAKAKIVPLLLEGRSATELAEAAARNLTGTEAVTAIEGLKDGIARLMRGIQKEETIAARIEAAIEQFERLLAKNDAFIVPKAFLDKVKEILKTGSLAEQLTTLQRFVAEAEQLIGRFKRTLRSAGAPTDVSPTVTREQRLVQYKPGESAAAKEAPVKNTQAVKEEAAAAPRAVETPVAKTVELPKALAAEDVSRFVKGIAGENVKLTNGATKDIAEFYKDNPKLRGALYNRLSEIKDGSFRKKTGQWKQTKAEEDVYHGRVGLHNRIFIRETGDGTIEIFKLENRGNIRSDHRKWGGS